MKKHLEWIQSRVGPGTATTAYAVPDDVAAKLSVKLEDPPPDSQPHCGGQWLAESAVDTKHPTTVVLTSETALLLTVYVRRCTKGCCECGFSGTGMGLHRHSRGLAFVSSLCKRCTAYKGFSESPCSIIQCFCACICVCVCVCVCVEGEGGGGGAKI